MYNAPLPYTLPLGDRNLKNLDFGMGSKTCFGLFNKAVDVSLYHPVYSDKETKK
jgi:hypothetical protein